MAIKLSTTIGDVSFDFEGTTAEFKELVLPMVEKAWERNPASVGPLPSANPANANAAVTAPRQGFTVRTIAARLRVDSGSELLLAAAASLAIFKGTSTFTRQELHDEMKEAAGFYKTTYGSNLSNYIDTLMKNGSLLEMGKETYALSDGARQTLDQKLT